MTGLTDCLHNDGEPVEGEQDKEVDVLEELVLHQGLQGVQPESIGNLFLSCDSYQCKNLSRSDHKSFI